MEDGRRQGCRWSRRGGRRWSRFCRLRLPVWRVHDRQQRWHEQHSHLQRVPCEERLRKDQINKCLRHSLVPREHRGAHARGADRDAGTHGGCRQAQVRTRHSTYECTSPRGTSSSTRARRDVLSCHAVTMKKNPVGHTEKCCKNIQHNISMTTRGKTRLKDAQDHQNHLIAKTIEHFEEEVKRRTRTSH